MGTYRTLLVVDAPTVAEPIYTEFMAGSSDISNCVEKTLWLYRSFASP